MGVGLGGLGVGGGVGVCVGGGQCSAVQCSDPWVTLPAVPQPQISPPTWALLLLGAG